MEKQAFFTSETVQAFNRELEAVHLGPLWNAIPELMPREPKPHAVPYLWRWETIREKLEKAKTIFTPDRGGERRAIYLQNPGLKDRVPWGWAAATQTLYAAVQLILPGEVAPSHRHTQNAIRFVISGSGAYTVVDGERVFMEAGDFLITPMGSWHGHGHEGSEPMLWLDCLDIPFIYAIGGTFFEPYPEKLQSPSVPDNASASRYEGGMVRPIADRTPRLAPLVAYKWEQTHRALEGLSRFDPDPYDGYAVEYINPSNGKTANPNLAAWMQKLPPGFRGKAHRHTHSVVYHVFRGNGYTVIDGVKFSWKQGDCFVIPNWAWHEHVNPSGEPAYLFSVSDLPILERLGLERKEAYLERDGHQEVVDTFTPV